MANPDWQETVLGDVLTVKHGHAFKGKYFGKGGAVRLVTPGNFFERGGFRDRGADQKSYDGPVALDYQLEPGSLVVAMTEQAPGLLGSAGLVPEDEFTWLHNQRIGLVLVRHGLADKDFIRYLLNSHAVREQLAATATGTKVRHTAPSRIEAVRTSLPSYWLQRRIGAFLSAFDDLIEINDRRIELLEALVRAAALSWVRPDRSETATALTAQAQLPQRVWQMGRIADLGELYVDGADPSEFDSDDRYVGLEHLPRRSMTLKGWGSAESVKSRKLRFQPGDTLFAKIRPNLHKVAWAPFAGLASSDAMVFRPREGKSAPAFLAAILASDAVVAEAAATASGTQMPRANPKMLLNFPVRIPGDGVLDDLETVIRSWLDWCAVLAAQNAGLKEAQGLLLPRLITGQLDISDLELGPLAPAEPQ